MKNYFRILFIRLGWKRCDHRNAYSKLWRDKDGTLFHHFDCPDCRQHDFGHVYG